MVTILGRRELLPGLSAQHVWMDVKFARIILLVINANLTIFSTQTQRNVTVVVYCLIVQNVQLMESALNASVMNFT